MADPYRQIRREAISSLFKGARGSPETIAGRPPS